MHLINGFNQCVENNFTFTPTHQRILIMLNNWIYSLSKITLVLLCELEKKKKKKQLYAGKFQRIMYTIPHVSYLYFTLIY